MAAVSRRLRPARHVPPHSVGQRAARQLRGVLPDGQPRTYALQLLRPASDDELTRIRSSWERALPGCSLVIITSDMRLTVACSPQERSALLRRLVSWRLAGEVTFLDDAIRGGYEALAEWRSAMR